MTHTALPIIRLSPTGALGEILEQTTHLPTLDTALPGDVVGFNASCERMMEDYINVNSIALLVKTETGLSTVYLSQLSPLPNDSIIRLYAKVAEREYAFSPRGYGMEWGNSSEDYGYDIRALYLLNNALLLIDNIHDPEGEAETFVDRSCVILPQETKSGHDLLALAPHYQKVESFINQIIPKSLENTVFFLE